MVSRRNFISLITFRTQPIRGEDCGQVTRWRVLIGHLAHAAPGQQPPLHLVEGDLERVLVRSLQSVHPHMLNTDQIVLILHLLQPTLISSVMLNFCMIFTRFVCSSEQDLLRQSSSNLNEGTTSTVNLTSLGPSTLRITGAPPTALVTLN